MLDFSKSERHLILAFLIIGLVFIGLSYFKKISPISNVKIVESEDSYIVININEAMPEQLERLPGIGPVLAQDIVSYREEVGRFRRPQEIKNIKGIGDKKFEKIKDLITIGE